jgi:hypothetical protein
MVRFGPRPPKPKGPQNSDTGGPAEVLCSLKLQLLQLSEFWLFRFCNEVHRVAIWIRWEAPAGASRERSGFVSPTGDLGENLGHRDLVRRALMILPHMGSGSLLVRKVLVRRSQMPPLTRLNSAPCNSLSNKVNKCQQVAVISMTVAGSRHFSGFSNRDKRISPF